MTSVSRLAPHRREGAAGPTSAGLLPASPVAEVIGQPYFARRFDDRPEPAVGAAQARPPPNPTDGPDRPRSPATSGPWRSGQSPAAIPVSLTPRHSARLTAVERPELVSLARETGSRAGFRYSSDDRVGRLLAVLAASVPESGRILELGTGTGVGTAWLVSGLSGRSDVEVATVESDEGRVALVRGMPWPPYVVW